MGTLTRRLFIGSGVTVLAAGGVSVAACLGASRSQNVRYDRLDVLLPDIVHPVRIGAKIRRTLGQDKLYFEAAQNLYICEAMMHECSTTRRGILRDGLRKDFVAGKMVVCDRFVVSETECIVAGLRYDQGRT